MRKSVFPRLRVKRGKHGQEWLYYDTQQTPRHWIPLGLASDPKAMQEYQRLAEKGKAPAGTVYRLVREYLEYLAAGGLGPKGRPITESSRAVYRKWFRHVDEIFGHMNPADVTQGDVSKYLYRCPRTSGRGEVGLLSGAFQHAMREGRLESDPAIGVKSVRPPSRRRRVVSDEEFAAIRAKASPMLRVAMDLAYAIGLRPGDLVRLRWDAFGDAIEHEKTKYRQRFPLDDDLRAILDEARAAHGRVVGMTILAKRGGRPVKRDTLQKWLVTAAKAAGVNDVQFRDLRAKAGIDKDAAGGNAQEFLGHTNAQTTEIYLRAKRIKTVTPNRRKG